MNLKEIGNLIIKRREFLNLRQSDLAEISQVAEKTLNQIEQGNGNPSFKTLNKVVEVLGLELNLKVKEVS
jgi:transcriptional regulator with XRE-family HTH domain